MRKPIAKILSDFYKEKNREKGVKSKNITWHELGISKQDREKKNRHKGVVVWLTGLPSSGKSTIAIELQALLFELGCNVYVLDGDNIRHGLNKDLGFSPEDREENIRRIGEVAKLFADAGFIIITSFISPYKRDRKRAREIVGEGNFVEVFVNADISICEARDTKGLYKKARLGEIKEFTGVSAPYERPQNPEVVVDTKNQTREESAKDILSYLIRKGHIKR